MYSRRPSTGLESNLTDIWGSAYAATLDGTHTMLGGTDTWPADVPPPVTTAQRARIVSFLANQSHGIFAAGQVRHLPVGESWVQEWCVPAGAGPGGPSSPKTPSWSAQRALFTPQVNPGSLYRCSNGT